MIIDLSCSQHAYAMPFVQLCLGLPWDWQLFRNFAQRLKQPK
jgi:hypothetical protein